MKPIKNTINGKNGSSQSSDQGTIIANSLEEPKDQFMLRFLEMEELDANIMNIMEQRAKKLKDDIAKKNEFFSIIAHDLRSPFNPVLESLELLKGKLDQYDKNELEKYINIAYSSAINTLSFLDNLLAWTISQNKEQVFNPAKTDLHKFEIAIEGNEIGISFESQ